MLYSLWVFIAASASISSNGPLIEKSVAPEDGAFAAVQMGKWKAEAETTVDYKRGDPPHIKDTTCRASNDSTRLYVYRDGKIDLQFGGEEEEFSTLNIDQIKIGNKSFEAKGVSSEQGDDFSNVDYNYPTDRIMVVPFRGYLTVRISGGFWVPTSYLLNDLSKNQTISIRYRESSEESNGSHTCGVSDAAPKKGCWIHKTGQADVRGLGQVLQWCQAAIASDAARILSKQQ